MYTYSYTVFEISVPLKATKDFSRKIFILLSNTYLGVFAKYTDVSLCQLWGMKLCVVIEYMKWGKPWNDFYIAYLLNTRN